MKSIVVAVLLVATACTASDDGPSPSPPPPGSPAESPRDLTFELDFPSPPRAPFGKTVPSSCPAEIDSDNDTWTWREGADLPVARTEVAVTALEGKVYVAGGLESDGEASGLVHEYDPKADEWRAVVPLPSARHHLALVSSRGWLWAIGGYLADDDATGEVWSWKPGRAAWTREPRLRHARGALAGSEVDGRIFAIGGATSFRGDGRLSGAVERLDPGADEWVQLEDLAEPRDHLAAAATHTRSFLHADSFGEDAGAPRDEAFTSGEVYVVAGRKLSLESNVARIDVLRSADPDLRDWAWGNPTFEMPRSRGGLSAVVLAGSVIAFGGEELRGTIAPVDVLHPGGDTVDYYWCGAPPLPTPRHGLGAAVIGNRVYVVGGGPEPGLTVSGANEILRLERAD